MDSECASGCTWSMARASARLRDSRPWSSQTGQVIQGLRWHNQNTFGPTEGQNEQWREANRRRQRQTNQNLGLVPPPPPPIFILCRREMEALCAPDRFLLPGGEDWDPAMRQKCFDGTRLVQKCEDGPHSDLLRQMDAELTPALTALSPETKDFEVRLAQRCPQHKAVAARLHTLFRKLGGAAKWTPLALWREIVARTDEVYVVAERLEPPFRREMARLVQRAGLAPDRVALQFAPLRDPVCVYERAQEFKGRFPVGLPEACVVDVLRLRIVCMDGEAMLKLLKTFIGLPGPSDSSPHGSPQHSPREHSPRYLCCTCSMPLPSSTNLFSVPEQAKSTKNTLAPFESLYLFVHRRTRYATRIALSP